MALAQRAFLTAQALPIKELADVGLFTSVAAPGGFDSAVASPVSKVASMAPLAAQLNKQSLNELSMGNFDETRLREREARTARSADFAEGREAFAQQRPPRFTGK